MKRILLILLMMGGIAYGQCPQVTSLSVSSLSTTGGKASYTAASGATLYVWGIYVPGGAFVTGGSTTSTTFNFTGLTAATTYRLKVRTTCGLSVSGDDSLTFSTLSASAMYTPLTAQGYQIKYLKADSGFNLPLRDTALLRGIDQAGAQVYKPGAGVFVYTGSYWQGISSGSGTIIITDSSKGIDSIVFNGYQECIYLHDSITPTCWQLNRFFDDVRLSDDSLWYKYYNAGLVIDSVPSGIKNVGAVWPLSYDGVDLTTSKPFNDSLYLSSLVLHGTSLYSKKLTGDSVFVGTMGAGGSTGIDSMYVTTDSLYQVFIYSSGRRDSVGYSGSSGSSLTYPNTTLKYVTGYGTFGSFRDTVRAALSTTGTGISYNNSTGVITGTALVSSDTSFLHNKLVASFVRNATRDSVILSLNDGTRYAVKDSSGGSGSSTLAALTDVLLASLRNNQVLQYDSVAVKWKNQTGIQVSLSGLANNQLLRYNSTTGYWENFTQSSGSSWDLLLNAGTSPSVNAIGTSDNASVVFKRNSVFSGIIDSSSLRKTAFGFNTLNGLTSTGADNTAFGYYALKLVTSGDFNTAVGSGALQKNTTGEFQTAVGYQALFNNTTGAGYGTAVGYQSQFTNSTGNNNASLGYQSLYSNTTGTGNTGLGYQSGYWNSTGLNNTSIGTSSLHGSGSFSNVTAIGYQAMFGSTSPNAVAIGAQSLLSGTGTDNTAIGYQSMHSGTNTGTYNTAIGSLSMDLNTSGSFNVALGRNALLNSTISLSTTALGTQAGQYAGSGVNTLERADTSIFIGFQSRPAADSQTNQIVIGSYAAVGNGSHTITLGESTNLTTKIYGITALGYGSSVASAAAIVPTGNLFHVTGTTTITSITATNVLAGTTITIIFDGALTFTDGSNLILAGNFTTAANSTITLKYDGANFYETGRSIN